MIDYGQCQNGRSTESLISPTRPGGNPAASNGTYAVAQRSPLLASVPSTDCAKILGAARERNYTHRQAIFFEGDPVQQVLLVIEGCVKIMQLGPNGDEVILRVDGCGEVVGVLGVTGRGSHCSTAQVIHNCRALCWPATSFEALMERFPLLRKNAALILEQRLQELEERFREISTEKVAPRLAHELLRLSRQVGRCVDGKLEIGLSREELAQMIGTTLFTVSRLLSEWEGRGMVALRRETVAVVDRQALSTTFEGGE
jgi:CRP-like cAMP-binding protein